MSKTAPTRRIRSVAFRDRVGRNPEFAELQWVTANDADFQVENHAVYGAGVWITWKDSPAEHRFVPISNIRAIDEVEVTR